jgi:hypothetical protein
MQMSNTPTDVGAVFAMCLLAILGLAGTVCFGIASCWIPIPVLIIPTCICGAITALAAYRMFK